MLKTVWAVVRDGKVEPLEKIDAPEGARVLLTLIVEDDSLFWLKASQGSLDAIWNNSDDDIYEQLLKE